MQDYHVPIALIRRACYPSGERLPKLVRIEFPPKAVVRDNLVAARGGFTTSTFDDTKGNLDKPLYQFYVGKIRVNDSICTCRWCGTIGFGVHFTKEHGKAEGSRTGCKRLLQDIYKTFVTNKVCMMCDADTLKTSWGVPLCSPECEKEWMFHNPRSLTFEIEIFEKARAEEEKEANQL